MCRKWTYQYTDPPKCVFQYNINKQKNLNQKRMLLLILSFFACTIVYEKITEVDINDKAYLPPRMPMYAGSSYHILYGNPKNQYGLDPGFYHPVFQFNYKKNKTTEDGKFLIPDEASSRKTSTCSFSSDISEFRGTQSYQEDLKKIATVTLAKYGIQAFSFSMSNSWQKIYNTTTVQKVSLTHAKAECQAYEIILDKFHLPPLSKDFVSGAILSYQNGNWTQFIVQFGTHYVHEIIMGGRVIQQIAYTYESIQKMQIFGLDISVTAKASFAQFFNDATYDWNKYIKNIEYSQKISTSKNQQYIGGQPPKTGNIYDWQAKIIDNPMPISYKMYSISQLFQKINDIRFNHTKAAQQFGLALSKECDRLHCRPVDPDFPKPPPAYIITQKTPLYGGHNGNDFDEFVNSTTMEVRRVHLRAGTFIDNLQLYMSDGVSEMYTSAVGGTGGSEAIWSLPDGQFINQIQYRSADVIDSLTFITNKGNKSPKYGGEGGIYQMITIPNDYRIVGFYGSYGNYLYKLGFIIAKTMYPSQESLEKGNQFIKIQLQ